MPSARTSVGNKEYEYKGKKEVAAQLQQAGNRRETIVFGGAAVAVALRHVIEPTATFRICQTFFHDDFSEAARSLVSDVWTAGRPNDRMNQPGLILEGDGFRIGWSGTACAHETLPMRVGSDFPPGHESVSLHAAVSRPGYRVEPWFALP